MMMLVMICYQQLRRHYPRQHGWGQCTAHFCSAGSGVEPLRRLFVWCAGPRWDDTGGKKVRIRFQPRRLAGRHPLMRIPRGSATVRGAYSSCPEVLRSSNNLSDDFRVLRPFGCAAIRESFVLMRLLFCCLLIIGGVMPAARSSAQDELKTSTELGITVAPDDIYNFIQETSDYWPLVRGYLASNECTISAGGERKVAANYFATVNEQLQGWLYGDDEAAASDVIDYMKARLRRYTLYRQLRTTIGNDALLAELKAQWEQLRRDNPALAAADVSTEALAELDLVRVEAMRVKMQQAELPTEKLEAALALWQRQGECGRRLSATRVGRELHKLELQTTKTNPQAKQLIIEVQAASDWAQIVKGEGAMVKLPDFLSAWDSLERYGIQQVTKTTSTEVLTR